MVRGDERLGRAREEKVAAAVNALMWFTGMKVREVMDYVQFSKKEINDVNVRRVVSHRLIRAMEAATPPKNVIVSAETSLDVTQQICPLLTCRHHVGKCWQKKTMSTIF